MKTLVLGLVAMLAVTACGAQPAEKRDDARIANANTSFGFGLFSRLVDESGAKRSVVISPASVSLALSMTYNGALGSTSDAMAKTLGYTGLSLEQVNTSNKTLMQNLQKPGEGIDISIANSLWARKEVKFKPDFLQRNNSYYQAKVTTLDFDSPAAADAINGWVKQKTRGKIDKIIKQTSRDAILYLVNAVYFKGLWSSPFDEKLTKDGKFELIGGKKKIVSMMHRVGEYEYLEKDNFQLINLGYGKGRISMYVILPKKGTSPSAFYKELTPDSWAGYMRQIRTRPVEVNLALPKFKLEYEVTANKALSAMGMAVAFSPGRANFKGMCKIPPTPNVYIGEVLHKTFIEVNEKGTEAAAVTSVGMRATAMPLPRKIVDMTVDRPFFFAIRDNFTGEMLFMGSVVEPN